MRSPGAEYRVIDGDARIAAGIRIIATPGHTRGHQSLVLDRTDRPVVLAGQAIYSKAEYEHIADRGALIDDDPPPDDDEYLASANRILELRPQRVHFSHDTTIWI
jgi:glyoxylase-like metal-dependent hydrolase (beta-lactamase superfamily II)